jgi:hypothetical protein
MGTEAELHDAYLASDAFWLWKESSQGGWGVFDHSTAPDGSDVWTERPQVVAWISRVHAARIAGDVVANVFDHASGTLHLEVKRGSTHGTPHDIYIPERAAATFSIACNGAALAAARDDASGLASVVCDGVLDIAP